MIDLELWFCHWEADFGFSFKKLDKYANEV